jgi:hypothetical protein
VQENDNGDIGWVLRNTAKPVATDFLGSTYSRTLIATSNSDTQLNLCVFGNSGNVKCNTLALS